MLNFLRGEASQREDEAKMAVRDADYTFQVTILLFHFVYLLAYLSFAFEKGNFFMADSFYQLV